MMSGEKYLIRTITSDRFVASSIRGESHIIGAKDDERTMIALIEADGIIPFTIIEMARVLASFITKEPFNGPDITIIIDPVWISDNFYMVSI